MSLNKVAILYSGGLDSLVTTWLYHMHEYDITLIHFNYGQKASKYELEFTQEFADRINAKLIVLDARSLFNLFQKHSLLLSNEQIDPETLKEAESDVNYVPMRNLILLSYAGAICEINNIDKLAYGANLTESGNYPDNSIRFKEYLNKVFKVSGKQNYQLELKAPLINLTKTEILALSIFYNAPIHLSLSCYYPSDEKLHCGKCGSCLLRKKAFERLGYPNEITGANVRINKQVIETVETILQTNAIKL